MGTWSKGTLFTGHEVSVYFIGCNVIIAFISCTSDEENILKANQNARRPQEISHCAQRGLFLNQAQPIPPPHTHNIYPLPIPLPKQEDHWSSSSHESIQKNALFQHSKALGTTFNHGVKYVKVNEGSSFI